MHFVAAPGGRHGTKVPIMTERSERLFRVASDLAEGVTSADSDSDLRAHMLRVLQPLSGFDGGAILTTMPGQRWSVVGAHVDSKLLSENYWRYSLETPPLVLHALSTGFVQDVDVVGSRTRDRAAVYREFHKPSGTRAFIARYWVWR
jgi:hypothetical protein